jgi:hypothetical protein
MGLLRDLLVRLQLDNAKFTSEMEKSRKSLDSMKKSIDTIKFAALVELGHRAYQAGQQFYAMGHSAATMGSDIERTAEVLGMTIKTFQQLSYSSRMADVDTQSFNLGMRNLVKAMEEAKKGTGDGAAAFTAMGISVTDSTGKTKSLEILIKEMAEKFPQWADGPNKMALAYAVFGKSAEAMIPWLNKGKKEIEENAEVADKLGLTHESYIKKLAASETAFKNFEEMLKGLKIQLAPLVELMAQMLKNTSDWLMVLGVIDPTGLKDQLEQMKELLRLKQWLAYAKQGGGSEEFIVDLEKRIKAIQDSWREAAKPVAPKAETPGIVDTTAAKAKADFLSKLRDIEISLIQDQTNRELEASTEKYKKLLEEAKKYGISQNYILKLAEDEQIQIRERGYERQKAIDDKAAKEREKAEEEARKFILTNMQENIEAFREYYNERARIAEAVETGEKEFQERELQRIRDGLEERGRLYQEWLDKYVAETPDDPVYAMKDLVKGMADTWTSAFVNMVNSTKSFSDSVKDTFSSLAQSVIHMILKMMAQWMLFSTITSISGGAEFAKEIGLTGGALPSLFKFIGLQEGAVIKRPTLAMVGEKGPEAVVPLTKGDMGGDTYIFISAVDSKSFDEALTRNNASVVKQIKNYNRVAGSKGRALS